MARILILVLVVTTAAAHAATVTGRVVSNHFRVAEYGVLLSNRSPTLVQDSDGRFTLRDVPRGTHQLTLVGWAFARKTIYVDVPEGAATVALGTITVDAGRDFTGRVVDAANPDTLVADATVLVFETRPVDLGASPLELMAGGAQLATTRYDGTFTVHGLPEDPSGLRVLAFGADDVTSAEHILERSSRSAELAIGRLGTITGKITNRSRMESPVILAKPAGFDGKPTIAGVDPTGNFRFDVPAGVYDLAFPDEKAAPMQVVVVENRTRTVKLTAPTHHVDLAVASPECTYVRLLGARPQSTTPRTEIGFEVCDDGRARFSRLPPGPYRVCVDSDDESGCKLVTLRAAPTTQSIRIAPSPHH